ncbi:cytochrome P450 [Trametes gibbosa]|nr:cytochrome P450 [Trametes gibbosa]
MSALFGSRSKHLPPGPPGLPILGNLTQIPSSEQWVWFHEISKKYGDVNTLHVLNTTLIVLNSHKAIDALFNKHAARYSSKPPRKMADLSDLTMTLPFMNPGEAFDSAREQFHGEVGAGAVGAYNTDYERSSRRFLQALAGDLACTDLTRLIDDSLGRVFLKVSTGYEATAGESILTRMNDLAHFAADVLGDKFQKLDILPFLCSLPTWAPVAGPLLKLGAKWKKNLHATADATVELAQEGKTAGNDSVMSNLVAAAGEKTVDDRSKMIAVTMNAGGMLATESATLTFLLAMAKHPEIQQRAQAEVDGVTGGTRLPTMADRARLPFVDAVLAEVLRWVSIAPGATLMANNWAISRDAGLFPEPEAFAPGRWLEDDKGEGHPARVRLRLRDDVLRPMAFAFGFGRHVCPGRFLADALLFSHLAHVLAVFEVRLPPAGQKTKRAADERMKVKSNGAACRVEEVYVQLAFRSDAAKELINQPEATKADTATRSAAAPASPVPNGTPNGKSSAAH